MKLELFSCVSILVKTTWGIVDVAFTIIAILPNYCYALEAQGRVCVGQIKCDGSFILSESVDLLNMMPIEGAYYKSEFSKS